MPRLVPIFQIVQAFGKHSPSLTHIASENTKNRFPVMLEDFESRNLDQQCPDFVNPENSPLISLRVKSSTKSPLSSKFAAIEGARLFSFCNRALPLATCISWTGRKSRKMISLLATFDSRSISSGTTCGGTVSGHEKNWTWPSSLQLTLFTNRLSRSEAMILDGWGCKELEEGRSRIQEQCKNKEGKMSHRMLDS